MVPLCLLNGTRVKLAEFHVILVCPTVARQHGALGLNPMAPWPRRRDGGSKLKLLYRGRKNGCTPGYLRGLATKVPFEVNGLCSMYCIYIFKTNHRSTYRTLINLVSVQWVRGRPPLSLSCAWWSVLWSLRSATSDALLFSLELVWWDRLNPNLSSDCWGTIIYLFIYLFILHIFSIFLYLKIVF